VQQKLRYYESKKRFKTSHFIEELRTCMITVYSPSEIRRILMTTRDPAGNSTQQHIIKHSLNFFPFPCGRRLASSLWIFFIHLYWKGISGDNWHGFFYKPDALSVTRQLHGRKHLLQSSKLYYNVATCKVPSLGDRSFTAAGSAGSTSVEQSTTSSPWLGTITSWVSPVTENAFLWLMIPAPSDLFEI